MRGKAEAVQRMQDYIEAHLGDPVTLRQLAGAAGYSPWHAARLFRELVGMPPLEYLRARRLSRAALALRDGADRVLDVALNAAFGSHEGFTRAFSDRFGITPEQYRRKAPPIALFPPRSALQLYLHQTRGETDMANENTIFVQVIDKPRRKLILLRSKRSGEYFEYCDEVGCNVWGILESVKGALGEPYGMWLPQSMRPHGTSAYAQGVEVPADYAGPVPDGMDIIALPSCKYMVFHGQPYPEEKMGEAIGAVGKAMEGYRPELYGWVWADDDAPRFQLAPIGERGYIEGRPVRSA